MKTHQLDYRRISFISVPLILILISLYYYIFLSKYVSTNDAYIKIGIAPIISKSNGYLDYVNIEDNQKVTKGEILLKLDSKSARTDLEFAQAHLQSTINLIHGLKSAYKNKELVLKTDIDQLNYQQKQFDRVNGLFLSKAVSEADLELAQLNLNNARKKVEMSKSALSEQLSYLDNQPDLELKEYSLYLKAKSLLDKAKIDLDYTIVTAPFDGYIANFRLKNGAFINQYTPLFAIIDPEDLWVEAFFKETDLENIRIGQKATIEVDSFPGKVFSATVHSVTKSTGAEFSVLPAQNSSGNWVKVTQRVMVRLSMNSEGKTHFSSGMSVYVNINTKS